MYALTYYTRIQRESETLRLIHVRAALDYNSLFSFFLPPLPLPPDKMQRFRDSLNASENLRIHIGKFRVFAFTVNRARAVPKEIYQLKIVKHEK